MATGGAAVVVEDSELEPAMLRELATGLMRDADRLRAMADAALGLARPDAARRVAGELLSAIGQASGR